MGRNPSYPSWMSCPPSASLARAMLALSRAGCSGLLSVIATGRRCDIVVVDGAARAARSNLDSIPLGDWLLSRGTLDPQAHRSALHHSLPESPIGAWLVAQGIVTQPEVEDALADQLRACVLSVFSWRDVRHFFESGSSEPTVTGPRCSIAMSELALGAARDAFDAASFETLLRTQGALRFMPAPFGRALLDDTTIFSSQTLRLLVRHGARLGQLARLCGTSSADLRTLSALCWLAAVVPAADGGGSYALLLRKHVQLQRQASPSELLELERGAGKQDARRALRRLAKRLHPDVLGPSAPAALRAVSGDLMRALVRAEEELRPHLR